LIQSILRNHEVLQQTHSVTPEVAGLWIEKALKRLEKLELAHDPEGEKSSSYREADLKRLQAKYKDMKLVANPAALKKRQEYFTREDEEALKKDNNLES